MSEQKKKLEAIIIDRTKKIESDKSVIMKQAEELQEMVAKKDQFLVNITHELRTPLTLIKGPIDHILSAEMDDTQKLKYLRTAQNNYNRLNALIEDLLQASLFDTGVNTLRTKRVVLYQCATDIINSLNIFAEEKGIVLQLIYNLDRASTFKLDQKKLEKIIINLLNNALKFTPRNGRITLNIHQQDSNLLFEVIDTGFGIKSGDQEKIFHRYYQSESSAKAEGLGIGLSFSSSLSRQLGGTLSLKSSSASGSTFQLIIPAEEISPTKGSNTLQKAVKHHGLSILPKILVIDDNIDMQNFLSQSLSDYYAVVTQDNGRTALDYLVEGDADNLPDIIICDIMMPEMDGFEFLLKLRKHPIFSNIPVVMLTARTDISSKLTAFRIGIDDYIPKPFERAELLVRLKNIHRRNIKKSISRKSERHENQHVQDHSINEWIDRLQQITLSEIHNPQMSVEFLADKMELSRMHLYRKMKSATGLTPKQYIKEIKLDQARNMITIGIPPTEIAEQLGYSHVRYFLKIYDKRFGI
jgi:DNA-binding response OmpR family regulator/nitrogen-specific signal transduction histidine kinase